MLNLITTKKLRPTRIEGILKMKITITRLIIGLICVAALTSCTDWQVEYQKRFSESACTVKNKYEFIKATCDKAEANKDYVEFGHIKDVDDVTLVVMSLSLPDEQAPAVDSRYLQNSTNAIIISNNKSIMDNSNIIDEDDGYSYYENMKIDNKESMMYELDDFYSEIVQPLERADYFVLVENSIFVSPCIEKGGFSEGGVTCKMTLYDLNSFNEMDSFIVTAVNSDRIQRIKKEHEHINQQDLFNDLYANLHANIAQKLKDDSHVHFDSIEKPIILEVAPVTE